MTGVEIEMTTYDYLRYSIINEDEADMVELQKMSKLKSKSDHIFTGKVLSKLWGISPSYVSKIFKENSNDDSKILLST